MSQPGIKTIWDQLVKDTKALGKFKDVRPLPANVVSNMKFLDSFPGLKMPACLIVLLGRQKNIKGSSDERLITWNAIFVDKDADGTSYAANIERAEIWDTAICDRYILAREVVVMGSTDIRAAVTNPRFSVYQLSFTTRQADTREPVA